MARDLEGKIFIVHQHHHKPSVAFVSPIEANRVDKELSNIGLHFTIREIFCFGNGLQRIFILMEENAGTGPVLAFVNGKDANCMSKLLVETGTTYSVTEVSCFTIMREQVLAKYKAKYRSHIMLNNNVNWCDSCTTGYPLVKKFKS